MVCDNKGTGNTDFLKRDLCIWFSFISKIYWIVWENSCLGMLKYMMRMSLRHSKGLRATALLSNAWKNHVIGMMELLFHLMTTFLWQLFQKSKLFERQYQLILPETQKAPNSPNAEAGLWPRNMTKLFWSRLSVQETDTLLGHAFEMRFLGCW